MCLRYTIPYDDFNGRVCSVDFIGTITTMVNRNAFRAGWKLIEVYEE